MAVYSPEFIEKLRRFVELRDDRDLTKSAADTAEEAYREAEAELWDTMDEDSQTSGNIKVDLGEPYGVVSFGRRETFFHRILNYDQLLEWLENTARADEFTQPRVVKARLNEIVRERLEAEEPMPPGLDWRANRYVSITRPKKS